MSHFEVVPDQMGAFEIYGREYEVSAATDVVVRFVEPEYDYLRYLDPEAQGITLHWLGQSALATIVGFGVPETRQRMKMQNCEHEEYLGWVAERAMGIFEQDLAELPDSDDIDEFFGDDNGTA